MPGGIPLGVNTHELPVQLREDFLLCFEMSLSSLAA